MSQISASIGSHIPISIKDIYVPIRIWIENNLINLSSNTDISQITDNIYVGNISTGTNLELLKEKGITHIISALSHFSPPHPNDFEYLHIQCYDMEFQPIIMRFQESNIFIQNAIKGGGKVYIHCMCGVSRSITLTIAYLIRERTESITEILEDIRCYRPIANPNPGFMNQLEKFQKEVGSRDKLLF
tara:strand:+ start:188 stop:748 length:561 start_codon:yes stop_codon:yes gene_type:complete